MDGKSTDVKDVQGNDSNPTLEKRYDSPIDSPGNPESSAINDNQNDGRSLESFYDSPIENACYVKVSEILGDRLSRIWDEETDGSAEKTVALLRDIELNPDLKNLFIKNPDTLRVYSNCIRSKYRTNITVLRYFSNGADKADYMKLTDVRGKDICLRDDGDQTIIYSKENGKESSDERNT